MLSATEAESTLSLRPRLTVRALFFVIVGISGIDKFTTSDLSVVSGREGNNESRLRIRAGTHYLSQ
jgi:purine nucleoside permease